MSDLESWHDRQLPDIGGRFEESIGMSREETKLMNKALPRSKHFIGTNQGERKESCSRASESLGVPGQANVFSGSACRDVSCFTFKEIEKKRLGMMLTSRHNNI